MTILLSDLIIGHGGAIHLLTQAMNTDGLPQSLLITGVPQLGKTTLARLLALALNCTGQPKPCRACSSCQKLASGNHPDIFVFDNSEETLKIEQIRALQHDLSLRPIESRYKVTVLGDFERATVSAANALLKTLEEPPPHVMLILTAKNTGLLLPTLVSRCQTVKLMPVSNQILAETLQTKYKATQAQANLLSRLASGRPGWAIKAFENPEVIAERSQYLLELGQILTQPQAHRLAYAQSLLKKNIDLMNILNLWLSWWRDLLLVHYGCVDQIVNVDLQDTLRQLAGSLSGRQITSSLEYTYKAIRNLNYNVNLRLNLEVLLLNLPSL